MLTVRQNIYLILERVEDGISRLFLIVLSIVYRIKIKEAEETVNNAITCVRHYFLKAKRYTILEIVYTKNTFINKTENKLLIYSNLLAPPLSF